MTYFYFLLVFLFPPIALLALFAIRKGIPRLAWLAIGVHVLIAVVYTTPWDNYLVATRVWWYDPALVTGLTLGYVPIEEYSFFVLQTIMSGLWIAMLTLSQPGGQISVPVLWPRKNLLSAAILGLPWLASVLALIMGWQSATYLSLILVWALPPVMLQVSFGWDLIAKNARWVLMGILIPTIYLSIADTLAISFGTWTINPLKTLGVHFPGGLPLEEVIFFLMTNILIVFGMTLSLVPESRARLRAHLQAGNRLRSPLKP